MEEDSFNLPAFNLLPTAVVQWGGAGLEMASFWDGRPPVGIGLNQLSWEEPSRKWI